MPDIRSRPCIRCGACDRVVHSMTGNAIAKQIHPQAILAALRRGDDARAIELGLERASGAGLDWRACDAACPTGIPISAIFAEKIAERVERERAFVWREHYRAHQARLAREEAEAAEQRAKLSAQPAVSDAVAAALARARKARGEDSST